MKTKRFVLAWALIAIGSTGAVAGSVGTLTTFQADTTAVASEVNGNFSAVSTAIDDNDGRLTPHLADTTIHQTRYTDAEAVGAMGTTADANALNHDRYTDAEAQAANAGAIGAVEADVNNLDDRLLDLEALNVSTSGIFPDAVSSTATAIFGLPADATSTSATVRVLVSGCGGSDAELSFSRSGVDVGSNGSFFLIPTTQVVSIPPNSGFPLLTFWVVEASFASGLNDVNYMRIGRNGGAALDTCTTDLSIRGVFVDYTTAAGTRSLFKSPKEMVGF